MSKKRKVFDPQHWRKAMAMSNDQLKDATRHDKISGWARCCASVLQRRLGGMMAPPSHFQHTGPKHKAGPPIKAPQKNLTGRRTANRGLDRTALYCGTAGLEGVDDLDAVTGYQHLTTSVLPVACPHQAFWAERGLNVRSFANPCAVPFPYPMDEDGSSAQALPSTIAGCNPSQTSTPKPETGSQESSACRAAPSAV